MILQAARKCKNYFVGIFVHKWINIAKKPDFYIIIIKQITRFVHGALKTNANFVRTANRIRMLVIQVARNLAAFA